MFDENVSQVVEKKCCLDDAKKMDVNEETIDATSNEINHVNQRRFSNGELDKKGLGKTKVHTRYRGNLLSSTHDLCKHGKRREEDDLVIKPLKSVKKKNVEEGGDLVKEKTLGVVRKSLEKPLEVAKKDIASEIVAKRSETKSTNTTTTPKSSSIVRMVTKTNLDVNKVSRIKENKSSKEDVLKSLKNKEKIKIDEPVIRCEDVLEKTLYVVESSIEKKKSEIQRSPEKKISRDSGKKSLSPSSEKVKESSVTRSNPKPIRQTTSSSKIGLSEKKQSGSTNLVTDSKPESKNRTKRIGVKVTPPPQALVSFKKGKVLEPKQEDATSKSIKFKKRVVQEPKLKSEVNNKKTKKNMKEKREVVWKMNGEGKREKVVLKHRKVEVKKKQQRLFNNVIEETVNKLGEVKKVKALVGAFETVISLQDNDKTYPKKKMIERKFTSSSQVVEG